MKIKNINGSIFKKSSFSPNARNVKCVGVSISQEDVLVTNYDKEGPMLHFKRDEWDAFIKGVKNEEFDLI